MRTTRASAAATSSLPYLGDFLELATEVRALGNDLDDLTAQMAIEVGMEVATVRVLGALVGGCVAPTEIWRKLRVSPRSVIVSLMELQARSMIDLNDAGEPILLEAGHAFYANLFETIDDCLSDELWATHFDDRRVVTCFVALCRESVQNITDYFAMPRDERGNPPEQAHAA